MNEGTVVAKLHRSLVDAANPIKFACHIFFLNSQLIVDGMAA